MNIIKKLWYRLYQRSMQLSTYAGYWREPKLFEGENAILCLPSYIKSLGLKKVLIITDEGLIKLRLLESLIYKLNKENIAFSIFDNIKPNPTVCMVEEAVKIYKKEKCQGIICFGGGSPIDTGKAAGARIAHHSKYLDEMKGVMHVLRKLPPLFAIPTTAGTGSEVTIAAVISDDLTHEKYQIDDLALIPKAAVLDPMLTLKLPPFMTATTGIDALTHAIEAYIGQRNTCKTKKYSLKAVNMIFKYLPIAYKDGTNVRVRENMLKASHYAGLAFTRAAVGYIHAMAHAIGGKYNIPHGLAVAIILPYVLEYYGKCIYKKLAKLWDALNVYSDNYTREEKANLFIKKIKELNKAMGIPRYFDCIIEEDIPYLVNCVCDEANPFYPVPRILDEKDIENLFYMVKK